MTEISVRALPTAFDPTGGTVTVATPSCCSSCCCCCCLATTALAVTATGGAAYQVSHDNRHGSFFPTVLGLLAVPAAIGAIALATSAGLDALTVIILAAGVTYVGVTALALWAAGAQGDGLSRTVGLAVLFAFAFTALFFLEVVLALLTAFLIELVAILTLFMGWRVGRWWGSKASAPPSSSTWPG